MIRNLKALGLAFVAVVAMSAVISSTAQALPQYTCSIYPCTATASNAAGNETLTTPGGTVQCNSHYLIEKQGGNAESIPAPSATVTVTATFTGCKAFGFLNSTINMNGCDYVFHAGAAVSAGVYNNSMDVVCPAGKAITITSGTCEVDIPAQTGLTNVKTTNLAAGTITVQPNVTNITINVTKDGFGCSYPSVGHFLASFHGDMTFARVGGGSVSVSGV
jgi:hypothetical protein